MASNSSPEAPGQLLRLSAAVGAVGTGFVVASAVLELGAAHWGLAAIVLPALVVHFFALFPEPRDARGRLAAGVVAGYGVAALLMAVWLFAFVLRAIEHPGLPAVQTLLQAASALWFATGLIAAPPRKRDLVQYSTLMFMRDALRIEPGRILGPLAKVTRSLAS